MDVLVAEDAVADCYTIQCPEVSKSLSLSYLKHGLESVADAFPHLPSHMIVNVIVFLCPESPRDVLPTGN